MLLSEAIRRMTAQMKAHGDVEVYFDCPKCGSSFTPNTVVGVAVHLTEKPPDGKPPREDQPT